MPTQLEVVNAALAQIGTRTQMTSMTDGSPEAVYANLLYYPLRDFMLREGDYEFSLQTAPAVEVTPVVPPWAHAYEYPSGAIRIRQLIPAPDTILGMPVLSLDPRPVEWNVFHIGPVRSIVTKVAIGRMMYTTGMPEDTWDAMFLEAFTRMLASELAFALENRIEASKVKLEEGINFAGMANLRDG